LAEAPARGTHQGDGQEDAAARRVELFYWSPEDGQENFGDHLSLIVATKILADRGLFLEQSVHRATRLLAIGSILHFARDGDVIWGTGRHGNMPDQRHRFTELDVRAVRGPLTREFLQARGIGVPDVYGDPALLLPELLPRWKDRPKVREALFVPNHDDVNLIRGHNVLDPLRPWNECLDWITSSAFVMGSSLHGLIVAEAFGIPARYVRLHDRHALFKYEDYVLGSGRTELTYARSIPEAREMGGMPAPRYDATALLAAFPFDLWEDQSADSPS
jgi:pyruvyltransferase